MSDAYTSYFVVISMGHAYHINYSLLLLISVASMGLKYSGVKFYIIQNTFKNKGNHK